MRIFGLPKAFYQVLRWKGRSASARAEERVRLPARKGRSSRGRAPDGLHLEDYKALPEDGGRWEVLEGRLCREPAPRPFHQVVVANLLHLLGDFARARGLGHVLSSPLDVVLSPENVVQPDLVFLPAERMHVMGEENVAGAPSLVVEVLSPTTRERDAFVKRRIYEHFGVPEYWLVDPEARTVEVLALEEGRYRRRGASRAGEDFSSPCFPGLTIRVEEIFSDPYAYR